MENLGKIVISGISGFVGSELKNMFSQKGYEVVGVKREQLHQKDLLVNILQDAKMVINLSGANIINRWTDEYKKLLYSSRIDTTKALVEAMSSCEKKPQTFISTSAVGIYDNIEKYSEDDKNYSNDFLSNLCQKWEEEALKANDLGIRTAIFRFGIVMGHGGALAKMLTPFKMGVGGTIGDGSQAFSFIHIDDLKSAYEFILENESLDGVFNLTAPKPTTNHGLTKALGNSLHRPTLFPVPEFVLNLIFSEGAKVLTDGQSAYPKRLLEAGFQFDFEDIDSTVENLV